MHDVGKATCGCEVLKGTYQADACKLVCVVNQPLSDATALCVLSAGTDRSFRVFHTVRDCLAQELSQKPLVKVGVPMRSGEKVFSYKREAGAGGGWSVLSGVVARLRVMMVSGLF